MDGCLKLDGCWLLSSLVGDSPFVSYYSAALYPPASRHRARSPAVCERMNVSSPSPKGLHVFLGKNITLAWISLPSDLTAELGPGIVTNQLARTDGIG